MVLTRKYIIHEVLNELPKQVVGVRIGAQFTLQPGLRAFPKVAATAQNDDTNYFPITHKVQIIQEVIPEMTFKNFYGN